MLDIKCPMCQTVYHSGEANIGRSLRCSICGSVVPILRDARTMVQSPPRSVRLHPKARIGNSKLRRPRVVFATAIFVSLAVASALVLYIRKPSATQSIQRGSESTPTDPLPPPGFTLDRDEPASAKSSETGSPGQPGVTAKTPSFTSSPPLVAFSADGVEEAPGTGSQKVAPIRLPPPRHIPRPETYNSLPNGSSIGSDQCEGGHGVLSVQNGTDEDAVVRLYDPRDLLTICWFSVKQNDSASRSTIPEGDYMLAYTMGHDWIESDDAFRWQPSYGEYERAFHYIEQRDYEGIQYKEISVTLQPVHGGNVRTRPISREEFLRGHRHTALKK
jgi:hypothetical protein